LAVNAGVCHPPGCKVDVVGDAKVARRWVRMGAEKSAVLDEVPTHVFRGSRLYILTFAGVPVSYHAVYLGRRKKNVWEPYANWYTAYTVNKYRRRGFARHLAIIAREDARRGGCVRLKSLAGTMLGIYLHAALGDQFWGVTDKCEVVVDTPLVNNEAYDHRSPPNAVRGAGPEPWSLSMVMSALAGRRLKYE
jgi:GNAT superfamily N-acetyltransferase